MSTGRTFSSPFLRVFCVSGSVPSALNIGLIKSLPIVCESKCGPGLTAQCSLAGLPPCSGSRGPGAFLCVRALGLRCCFLGVLLIVLQPSAQSAGHEATSSLPAHMLFQKHLQLVCAAFLRMCHVSGQCWGKLGCFFFPPKTASTGFSLIIKAIENFESHGKVKRTQ